jgi:hypothetical protein
MWPQTFDARLKNWYALRTECQTLPIETALKQINQWWFGCPWRPYYLHWDEQHNWPDPWQLLSDDVYCEVARGLGILYTINLLDRADLPPARLILTQSGYNLVLVGNSKYILNWGKDNIVNTSLDFEINQQYQQHQNA